MLCIVAALPVPKGAVTLNNPILLPIARKRSASTYGCLSKEGKLLEYFVVASCRVVLTQSLISLISNNTLPLGCSRRFQQRETPLVGSFPWQTFLTKQGGSNRLRVTGCLTDGVHTGLPFERGSQAPRGAASDDSFAAVQRLTVP